MMEIFAASARRSIMRWGACSTQRRASGRGQYPRHLHHGRQRFLGAKAVSTARQTRNAAFNGVLETWQSNLKHIDELGGPKFYNHFPAGWAWAMDTVTVTKQVARAHSAERESGDHLLAREDHGQRRRANAVPSHHGRDATIFEAANIRAPETLNGITAKAKSKASHGLYLQRCQSCGSPKEPDLRTRLQPRYVPGRMMASSLAFVPCNGSNRVRPRTKQNGALPYRPGLFAGR